MSATPKPARHQLLKWASVLVLTIAGAYFVMALYQHGSSIPHFHWDSGAYLSITATVLLVLFNLCLGGLMWKILLSDQGFKISALQACRIVGMSQIGKYLPGNVGHMVGQVGLTKLAGVPVGVSIAALLVSSLWLAAVGLIMGSIGLMVFIDAQTQLSLELPTHPLFVLLFSFLILSAPWLGLFLLNRFLPALSAKIGSGKLIQAPRFRTALLLSAGFFVSFFVLGLMLKLQANYFFDIEEGHFIQFAFLFAAAWVAGYLLPGAPGGLGVREAITVALLTPVVGPGAALGISVTMRVVTILGDGLAFVAAWLIGQLLSRTTKSTL